jgi:hypothetical protein
VHDWSLRTITVDWEARTATLHLRASSRDAAIVARGLHALHVPMAFEWGPSVSINRVEGPIETAGRGILWIEMQTGDTIELVADRFEMPEQS